VARKQKAKGSHLEVVASHLEVVASHLEVVVAVVISGGGGGRGAIGAAVRSPNRFFSMCTHASYIARLHASMLAPHPLVFILLIILIKMRVIIFLCSNESERTIVNATD